ncbi:phospholipase D-like domain-containing protein [Piscinibacter koreensis]|uniref:Phospholipase D family protein n=1 Tax=Piscinibacter koreensis TaxID=2742824 RepID=A0A7Y6NR73_9BURK|nr:phospholipase D family protein [Schlegelella koreensis]NUZ07830.1 phospholipase D family protein [Schlegelella koreensis]
MNHLHQAGHDPPPAAARPRWLGALRTLLRALPVVMLALAGCASLPSPVERPTSHALDDVASTALARVAAASLPDGGDARSGFRLLASSADALDARIGLTRRAEKSLDVQYYLIASDATGLEFLGELRDAAARGVRVRLMIDDLYAGGQDALLAGLEALPNVEVRLFNPLPSRRGGVASRVLLSLHEFSRINRRMHNKLLIADNSFAVTGGRNVANEYFGRGAPANFIDMDVLASGPVVGELSAVFDRYWNSEQAYPARSVVSGRTAPALRDSLARALAGHGDDRHAAGAVSAELDAGRIDQHLGRARVLADLPGKVAVATQAAPQESAVSSATLDLIGSAREDVLIATPYFIPGARGVDVMRQAVASGVRLSVVTNSLATTDEPLVHLGYARHRSRLLAMGVGLYELMPTDQNRRNETTLDFHGSLGRLHAKVAVVDHRHLFIGSMNMDRRSARWNTEIGLVIDSAPLAAEVTSLLQHERLPSSWRLRLAQDDRRIEWVAGDAARGAVHASEPAGGARHSLWLRLAARLVSEDLL